jgi:hypothetical protein
VKSSKVVYARARQVLNTDDAGLLIEDAVMAVKEPDQTGVCTYCIIQVNTTG